MSSEPLPEAAPSACPFCGSSNTEKLTDFGTTLAFQQHYCQECRTVFEAIKWRRGGEDLPASSDDDPAGGGLF